MKKILFMTFLIMSFHLQAQTSGQVQTLGSYSVIVKDGVKTAKSPDNRVALLELYTSEGCSSCPPADRFLSSLKAAGISDKQLVPLAFHVTYWDYIGWKDRFAKKQYDERQRELAHKSRKKSVYTPQFVLSGKDYRSYASFSEDVNKLASEKATIDLMLAMSVLPDGKGTERWRLNLISDISNSQVKDVALYVVVVENDLTSTVSDGENDGEKLHHDYVVRQVLGPYIQSKPENQAGREQIIIMQAEWKREDLSVVAFAENPHTGEVLQAVSLQY